MSGKKKTIISISVVGGAVKLTSSMPAGDIEGGHVRTRPGRRLRWEPSADDDINNRVKDFDLAFQSFDTDEGAVVPDDDWPFTAHDAEPYGAEDRLFTDRLNDATMLKPS